MATVEVTLTGDVADVVDEDFTRAQVRLRSNAHASAGGPGFLADPDSGKIRVLDEPWQDVAADGTYAFTNVIASADTIVAGTLQYYVDIKVRLPREWRTVTLGPYALSADANVANLEALQPTGMTRLIPDVIDADILATAETYTDDQIDAHEAAANPHPIYARAVNAAGVPTNTKFILVGAGGQFPPVEVGAVLIYGGL